ncbi:DEAD/DEAH box helicase [Novispirillum sp. DQ9]|uniref:DEAD/DEAH box helicase n=1 Tax=Novispirillum sp. DQ9 TaxID=3398612 RepID=UPI003C7D6163
MTFSELALHPMVLRALEEGGYTEPTPVQSAAVPPALEGKDLLATAETGTGKTAAFLLPALTRMIVRAEAAPPQRRLPGAPRILVLAPTRELASQVTQAVRKYGKHLRLSSVDVVGGMPYREQLRLLSKPIDVVVATPGRLIDHVQRGRIDLSGVETLILDEADRMLDMGFSEAVDFIAAACPHNRQTLLFTATLDRRMAQVAERLLREPVRIAVERTATALRIEQRLHMTDDLAHKRRLLHHFASHPEVGKAIVFAATKRDADTLAEDLTQAGHQAAALHGDMSQGQRNRTLQRLRTGQVRLLVATDVAARGIDVKDISHVINFDLPRVAEDYVHRIGRTGRAGAEGIAISFAGRADRETVARIERFTRETLPVHVVPGLEPRVRVSSGPRPSSPGGNGPGANRGPRPANTNARPWHSNKPGRSEGGRSEGGRSFGGQKPSRAAR